MTTKTKKPKQKKHKTAADIPVTGDETNDVETMGMESDVQEQGDAIENDTGGDVPPIVEETTEEAESESVPVVATRDGGTDASETPQSEMENEGQVVPEKGDTTQSNETECGVSLALTDDSEELERVKQDNELKDQWREKVNDLVKRIDDVKSIKKRYTSEQKELEGDLRDLLLKGPETMHGRPLLDLAETEPQPEQKDPATLWRETPIDQLDLTKAMIAKVSDHFKNVGQLVDWLNTPGPPKKSGLGKKAIETLQDACNKLQEPVLQAELAKAGPTMNAGIVSGETEEGQENVTDYNRLFSDDPEMNDVASDSNFVKREGWSEALELVDAMINDKEDRYEFASDYLINVGNWIEENEHVTEKQIEAIENIHMSVDNPIVLDTSENDAENISDETLDELGL